MFGNLVKGSLSYLLHPLLVMWTSKPYAGHTLAEEIVDYISMKETVLPESHWRDVVTSANA